MNLEKIALSLLSFGETGMELITSQEVENIDEDHVSMIGNFYSNVLGAAEQSSGLFGPLPIAYRYDLLLFMYAFNAFDPNLRDERVIKNNNMTRASILLFFPTPFDSVFSNQRKIVSTIIEQWTTSYAKSDIRKATLERLNELKEKLLTQIITYTTSLDFKTEKMTNLLKIMGKNFFLLETISHLYQKKLTIRFISNSYRLQPVLKRAVLNETIDNLVSYSNNNNHLTFNLKGTIIEVICLEQPMKTGNQEIKGSYDGIFLFYDFYENAANNESFTALVQKIIDYAPKQAKITYCYETTITNEIDLQNSKIFSLLSSQRDRSISLIDINSKNSSLEIAVIEFIGKIISDY